MNNYKYLFDVNKFKKNKDKYDKIINQDKNIININRLDYFFLEKKIIKENIINYTVSGLLNELIINFKIKDFIDKEILIIDKNFIFIEILNFFLKNKLKENKITQIILPRNYSWNNIIGETKINYNFIPNNINTNKLNLIQYNNIYIDNNIIQDKKYDILCLSTYHIDTYYVNLIKNSKIEEHKKIILLIMSNYYILINYINIIFNNINDNGNVILVSPGIITKNIINILSLLFDNFEDYNFENYRDSNLLNINNTRLYIHIYIKKFKKNIKSIKKFNEIYKIITKQYKKFEENKITNINELFKLFTYDYGLKDNNKLINKFKKYYEIILNTNSINLDQLLLILENKLQKDIIQKEVLIKAFRISKKVNFTLKENYNLNSCIINYNDILFSFFYNIKKHYYKINNKEYNISIINPTINLKHWMIKLLDKYYKNNFILKIQDNKIYNNLLDKINKNNKKILNDINKNKDNNYIDLTIKSLEIYEILTIINLFTNKNTNILYLNEYDGSFISAFNIFINNKKAVKKYKSNFVIFKPNSYLDSKDNNIDYDLNKIINNDDLYNDGNINELETMNYFCNKYKKINLITINSTDSLKELYSYIILSLNILNKNGNMIFSIDIDSLKYSSIVSIITLITTKFNKVLLYKGNVDIIDNKFYIVCIKYIKPINKNQFRKLYNFTKNFDENKQIVNLNKVKDEMKYNIMFGINKIIQNYTFNINRIINFTSNYKILSKKQKNETIKMILLKSSEWIDEFKFNI